MEPFDQERFYDFILDNNVIGFFPEKRLLASGRKSHWYANWRTVGEDPYLIDQLSDFVLAFAQPHCPLVHTFYGVPEGATKLALITQFKHAQRSIAYRPGLHALAMGRGNPKPHGDPKDRFFLGVPKGLTVVIEDVTMTGDSLMRAMVGLEGAGVNLIGAITLLNRMERRDDGMSVQQALEQLHGGLGLFSMSVAHHILPRAYERLKPERWIADAIEQEFEHSGMAPIKLG